MSVRNLRGVESLESRRVLAHGVCFSCLAEVWQGTAFEDNRPSGAQHLGELTQPRGLEGSVSRWDRRDFYHFEIADASTVDVGLTELIADADLYLYDAQLNRLARSIRGGSQNEFLRAELEAGEYYLQVKSFRGATTPYQLLMKATPSESPVPVAPRPPATAPTPPPADLPLSQPEAGGNPPPTVSPVRDTTPLTSVPWYGGQQDWNLNAINAPESWSAGFTGSGVVVAVVDTGVDLSHVDLVGNLWENSDEIPGDGRDNDGNGFVDDVSGWDFVDNDALPDDLQGHGTHVAGTIAAGRNGFGVTGVAYDAAIMPVRVLDHRGSGSSFDVGAGIRYAVDNGADVINLSLGGTYSASIASALRYAENAGVIVVAASGNEGASVASFPARHSRDLENVLAVGAYQSDGQRAPFSNLAGDAVQVMAPGASILSTGVNQGYRRLSGTSMATPHVAGLAALILSANPDWSPREVRQAILVGADTGIGGSPSLGVNAALSVAWAARGIDPFSLDAVA